MSTGPVTPAATHTAHARWRAWRAVAPLLLAIGALALVARVASAQGGGPGATGVLDQIRDVYRTAAGGWRARLLPLAQRIFVLLATLEFAVSGALWALRRESLDEIAAKLVLKFALVAFLLSVLGAFATWVPPIVNGFAFAGEHAIGGGLTSPSDIVEIGRETAARVLQQLSLGVVVRDPVMAVVAALAAMLIALAYIWIAAQLVLVMIEGYVVVLGGGVLFLGFAASRWTAFLAENLIAYAVAVGVRMFLLYLVVGVGIDVARSWIPLIQGSDFFGPASPMLQVFGGAVIFAIVATILPTRVAARLSANAGLGLGAALRALS